MASYVPNDYTFIQALCSDEQTRAQAIQFIGQICLATVIIPLITTLIAYQFMPKANLLYMLSGVGTSLVFGLVFGILPRLFSNFRRGIAGAVGFGVVFGSILCILFGIYSNIAQSTAPTAIARAVDSSSGKLANALLLGSCIGLFFRIFIGAATQNMKEAMKVGLIIIIPMGLFLAFFSKPHVLMTNRIAAISIILSFTGWFALPLQMLISISNLILVRANSKISSRLWTMAPVKWDDFLIFPAPDTVPLLVALWDANHDLYHKALERVQLHAFQSKAAEKTQKIISKR